MKRVSISLLPCLLLIGCASTPPGIYSDSAPTEWGGHVVAHGALRAMFHQGRTETMVSMDELLPNPKLYAIGALSELTGEITVIGGLTYISYPDDAGGNSTNTTSTFSKAPATLLVSTSVPKWQSVITKQAIDTKNIDKAIGELAASAGMNLEERFPFLIEGEVENLHWHVVDGRLLSGGGSSHEDHLAAATRFEMAHCKATLIGFYSATDQGVFTHMDSMTHIHCAMEGTQNSGHVDQVTIPAGTVIQFPAIQ